MAEIEEECIFYTKADQVRFLTQTNGDTVHIKNLKLTQGQAASLVWLINAKEELEFEIRKRVQ